MDASTTTAKRKRPATDIDAVVDEVSDAEVEEFYAILRRLRDASRRLCTGAGPAPRVPAWRPSFSWEDFAPAPSAPVPDERVAENATPPRPGLDLNAEPEPDAPNAGAGHPTLSARPRVTYGTARLHPPGAAT